MKALQLAGNLTSRCISDDKFGHRNQKPSVATCRIEDGFVAQVSLIKAAMPQNLLDNMKRCINLAQQFFARVRACLRSHSVLEVDAFLLLEDGSQKIVGRSYGNVPIVRTAEVGDVGRKQEIAIGL